MVLYYTGVDSYVAVRQFLSVSGFMLPVKLHVTNSCV